jgi:outer membrane protein OmpA-like peptidoglycan-associated protein
VASISVQRYQFNPNLTYEFVESSNLYDPYLGFAYPTLITAGYSYINDPFVIQETGTKKKLTPVLDGISSYQFGIHRLMNQDLSLGFRTSVNEAVKKYDPELSQFVNVKSTSLGDSYLSAKYRFYESMNWIHSGVFDLGLPTGDKNVYLSEGLSYSVLAVSEYLGTGFRLSGNLGFKYAPDAQFLEINETKKIISAFGGFISLNRTMGLTLEFKKDFTLSESSSQASEVHLGMQKKIIHEGWTVFGSVGTGNVSGIFNNQNGSDYRIAVGLKYTPEFQTGRGVVIRSDKMSFAKNSDYQKSYASGLSEYSEIKHRRDFFDLKGKAEIAKVLNNIDENSRLNRSDKKSARQNILKNKNLVASNAEGLNGSAVIHESDLSQSKNPLNINHQTEIESDAKADIKPDIELCEFYNKVKVEFPIKVYFDFDKYNIKKSEHAELKRATQFINQYSDKFDFVKISGHTDSIGTKEYNQILSEKRALAVKKYLEKSTSEKNQKVSYQVIGYGKNQRQIASEKSKSDFAKNRRGEITIEFVMKKQGIICPSDAAYKRFKDGT